MSHTFYDQNMMVVDTTNHEQAFSSTLQCLRDFIKHVELENRSHLDGETLSKHYGDVFAICTQTNKGHPFYRGADWIWEQYQYILGQYLHEFVFLKLKNIKDNNFTPDAFLKQYITSWSNFKTLLASLSLVFRYLDEWHLKNSPYTLERRSMEMWHQELYDLKYAGSFTDTPKSNTFIQQHIYRPAVPHENLNAFLSFQELLKNPVNMTANDVFHAKNSIICTEDTFSPTQLPGFEYPAYTMVRDVAIHSFTQIVAEERRNPTTAAVDTSLLRNFTDALWELGLKSSYKSNDEKHVSYFYAALERAFLDDVRNYYNREVKLVDLSFEDYTLRLQELFSAEKHRVNTYMKPSSVEKVNAELHNITLKTTLAPLLDKHGAMEYFTSANNLKYTTILFDLLEPHQDTLRIFARKFQEYVQQLGAKLTADFAYKKKAYDEARRARLPPPNPNPDPVELVQNIINLDSHFRNTVVMGACKNNPVMLTHLRQASESYINTHESIISSILAQYLHSLLSARSSKRQINSTTSLSEQVLAVSHIFKYIRNKDIFEHEYQRLLCQRILSGDSLGQSGEQETLNALTKESGADFSRKAESIQQDLEVSKNLTATFTDNRAEFLAKHGVDVQFYVCTMNSGWVLPQSNYATRYDLQEGLLQAKNPNNPESINNYMKLPPVMSEIWAQFGQFYCQHHDRRYLEFRLDDGICEVTYIPDATKPQNAKILVVTPIMAVILMYLSKQPKYVFWRDLVTNLSIDPQLLADHLLPLCFPTDQPTKCIVRKSTPGSSLQDDCKLILSKQFESNMVKHYIRYERKQTVKDVEKRDIELDKFRLFQCKAVMVRYMKMTKECDYNVLLNEAVKQLSTRFTPSMAMLKDALESLIENEEALERDQDDRNLLHYKA